MALAEYAYPKGSLDRGYNGRTLYVHVGDKAIREKPVDDRMKELFVGGRGFDLWLLWNAFPQDRAISWEDPLNEVVIASGPLGGTAVYPGSGKSIAVAISPLTDQVVDSNVGGYFGPFLKFAGFDAIEVQGKALRDVIVVVDGVQGKVRIEEAGRLPETSYELSKALHDKYAAATTGLVSVVTSGPGARHTRFGCLNFSFYDKPRKEVRYKQAGRGGIGTVLRNKRVLALVAIAPPFSLETQAAADISAVKEAGKYHNAEIRELDPKQNEMAVLGTTHITTIMDHFDLLPVHNFRFGSHKDTARLGAEEFRKRFHPGFDGCWTGCTVACAHGVKDFELKTGPMKGQRVWVDGPEYETVAGCGSSWGVFDPDFVIEVNFYCDTYGIDTISVGTAMAFAMECYESGQIDKRATGGLDLRFGNAEAAMEVLHQMGRGEGFGTVVGQGVRRMKRYFAERYGADPRLLADIGMESKGLEFSEYVTKESLAQQGGYGLALKGPQHDEAWLIFMDQVHKYLPTFEQKAEALHWFPMWRTWFGINGLCKLPWNDIVPADNGQTPEPAKVMKHVLSYAKYFSGVTGRSADPDEMIRMSETVYNFQRVFNARMGHGTRREDTIPYRAMGPVTQEEYESRAERYDKQLAEQAGVDPKGKTTGEKRGALRAYREAQYAKLQDAVYARRGWDANGIPTDEKLKKLGIDLPEVLAVVRKARERVAR